MYRSDDGSSAAASFQPRNIPYAVPLDGALQSRSLQPLGALQFNRPYASLSFTKIASTLSLPSPNAEHDALKLTALGQLTESLSRPESVSAVLAEGVFAELLLNASNDSAPVRVLSTQCLAQVTKHRAGREFALAAEIVPRLSGLADESRERDEQVRRNVLQCFVHMVGSAVGIVHLQSRGVLQQCIRKIPTELDYPTHARCLQVLAEAVRDPQAWSHCMQEGVVDTLAGVIQSKLASADHLAASQAIREAQGVVATGLKGWCSSLEHACRLVAYLAAPALAGKNACVEAKLVHMLTPLLAEHPVAAVRVAASLALQNLTVAESGKRSALEAGSLSVFLNAALTDSEEMVQCQSMQCLANMAEHPKAKVDPGVVAAVEQLRTMQQAHDSSKVRHAAKLAVDQITWQP